MPELPEVETIRRGLEKRILNKKIVQVKVLEKKSFIGEAEEVLGRKIEKLGRRGKVLIIELSKGESFLIHLRMTGQLIYIGRERFAGGHPNESFVEELPNKQTRVIIEFSDGAKLFFNDQRKFGFIKVVKTEKIEEEAFIRKLGKEPWEITVEEFYEKLKRHKNSAIKAVILDQEVIAGLGNIYADEALYFSGIRPTRKAGEISKLEAKRLILGAKTVMERSLEAGGSTIKNYVKADGTRGNYLDLFAKVYGRGGEKCEKCGGEIKKIKVGGRGTHYCEECQK
ncbi:bifunctional DNA-formamidopyrimidine glycosylase/DNA-(apurinic or apyrimidinic site) lyase [Candidatus Saccharibacteria bacterium]|nr:bifunctional DNA-formamidopyrimidine glycosylase/DNA-(apurinic or apyrimidinic site) lyase [Candidatus Saccharibacteria bacterium]